MNAMILITLLFMAHMFQCVHVFVPAFLLNEYKEERFKKETSNNKQPNDKSNYCETKLLFFQSFNMGFSYGI